MLDLCLGPILAYLKLYVLRCFISTPVAVLMNLSKIWTIRDAAHNCAYQHPVCVILDGYLEALQLFILILCFANQLPWCSQIQLISSCTLKYKVLWCENHFRC